MTERAMSLIPPRAEAPAVEPLPYPHGVTVDGRPVRAASEPAAESANANGTAARVRRVAPFLMLLLPLLPVLLALFAFLKRK